MGYDYTYVSDDEFLIGFLLVYAVIAVVSMVVGIAMYVIRSLSVQTLAKRRGLNHAWLTWLPVGSDWILGSISDQFKYLTQGKDQTRRKVLLGLSIASLVCGMVTVVMYVVLIVQIVIAGDLYYYSDAEMARVIMKPVVGLILVALVAAIVGITRYVFRCLCKYDLYKSSDPRNAVAFLVLGILFSVTEPFFLLSCRNKDGGMPPRKPVCEPVPIPEPIPEPWGNNPEE